LWSRWLWL